MLTFPLYPLSAALVGLRFRLEPSRTPHGAPCFAASAELRTGHLVLAEVASVEAEGGQAVEAAVDQADVAYRVVAGMLVDVDVGTV